MTPSYEIPLEVIERLSAEWDAAKCAACGLEKWKHYPFCRSCSIRVIRIKLLKALRAVAGMTAADITGLSAEHAQRWAFLYDRARDYLIVSKKHPIRTESEADDI